MITFFFRCACMYVCLYKSLHLLFYFIFFFFWINIPILKMFACCPMLLIPDFNSSVHFIYSKKWNLFQTLIQETRRSRIHWNKDENQNLSVHFILRLSVWIYVLLLWYPFCAFRPNSFKDLWGDLRLEDLFLFKTVGGSTLLCVGWHCRNCS